jgi:molybdopterin molybdotransferase
MPQMFKVVPPAAALAILLEHLAIAPAEDVHAEGIRTETIPTTEALGRVLSEAPAAPEPLPAFTRSTMDGYAVRAADTYGATESLPAYLTVVGEVAMGQVAETPAGPAQAILVHTGGMIPPGADAVVMLEQTQKLGSGEIEVLRPVAPGENLVTAGEDVKTGEPLFPAGHLLRPQDIGGLLALGITHVSVAVRPRVAIISTGDEIIPPEAVPRPGQVRDVNTYTVAGLVTEVGGIPLPGGIVPDDYEALLGAARAALDRADVLVVSTRDFTADVVNELGRPGVLVHGVALKPGKPTILGICAGRPVLGLPGNPVSAMVVAGLFLRPLLAHLQGMTEPPAGRYVAATLARNVSSQAGREDHVPVRIVEQDGKVWAEPVLGKSNLIYTLIRADGTIEVPLDANGLHRGDLVRVRMF